MRPVHPVTALIAACASVCPCAKAVSASPEPVPAYIAAALADPGRPPDQVQRDVRRKPAALIAFAGVKPGDRVADLVPSSGYYTRIFSRVVGPAGRVYAFTPAEELRNCSAEETAGSRAMAHDPRWRNVMLSAGPIETFAAPEPLDMVWTSLNYHDFHDKFMGPTNVAVLNQAIFAALKPGGVLLVVDHAAEPGSGLRDTETLHRIDPEAIKKEVEAAGFVLDAQSDILRQTSDDHRRPSFDPAMHDRTDQVVLKFRRPG
jgi:predicted methyltransferase